MELREAFQKFINQAKQKKISPIIPVSNQIERNVLWDPP